MAGGGGGVCVVGVGDCGFCASGAGPMPFFGAGSGFGCANAAGVTRNEPAQQTTTATAACHRNPLTTRLNEPPLALSRQAV